MKMKGVIIFLFVFLVSFSFVSASLEKSFSEIDSYITQYDSGEITAPQLIVYIDYSQNKMYGSLSGERQISELEVKKFFEKVNNSNNKGNFKRFEYQKIFQTKDFQIIFYAYPFVRHDREYYESKEDLENSYYIDYQLYSSSSVNSFSSEFENFVTDLKGDLNKKDFNYDKLKSEFSKLRNNFQKESNCEEILKDLGFIEYEKKYPSDKKNFYYNVSETKDKKCWKNTQCQPKCETKKDCSTSGSKCSQKEVCSPVCSDVFNASSNSTNQVCKDECKIEEVCEELPQDCREYQNCYDECKDEEKCEEFISSEIKLEANCDKDFSNLNLNSWGDFEKYQGLNEGGWDCQPQIDSLVGMRKALQKDFNEDFAKWYFEDFLIGDYDKILNGAGGFREALWRLIRIEEEISNNLQCSKTGEWPEGFEKIEFNYKNNNTNVEVWEKSIPISFDQNKKYYTTLFKYSWMPDKEIAKDLINYMVLNNSFGPNEKEISKIQSDEGQMEIINSLSERYGGSFDVQLSLKESRGDFEVKKYLQINPDVILRISDFINESSDISIEMDYDVAYNFVSYMINKFDGEKIEGPFWVQIEEDSGPANLFSALGAISKAWKEGVTIKPRYALIKLLFNVKDISQLMSGPSKSSSIDSQNKQIKISGKAVLDNKW